MSLDSSQIERVREIIDYQSYSATSTLVSLLNAAQESATVDDIDQWETAREKYTEIKAGLLGANIDPEKEKLDIRNRVRVRLGLSRVTADTLSAPIEIASSHPSVTCKSEC